MEEDAIPVKEGDIRDHVDLLYFGSLSTEVEQAESALSVIEMEMESLAKEETTIDTKLMEQSFSMEGSIIMGSGGEVDDQLGFIPDVTVEVEKEGEPTIPAVLDASQKVFTIYFLILTYFISFCSSIYLLGY